MYYSKTLIFVCINIYIYIYGDYNEFKTALYVEM